MGAKFVPHRRSSAEWRPAEEICFCDRISTCCIRICGLGWPIMANLRIAEAAALLGVSDDTVRRWLEGGPARGGQLRSGPKTVDAGSVAVLMAEQSHLQTRAVQQSARNRFPGIATGWRGTE